MAGRDAKYSLLFTTQNWLWSDLSRLRLIEDDIQFDYLSRLRCWATTEMLTSSWFMFSILKFSNLMLSEGLEDLKFWWNVWARSWSSGRFLPRAAMKFPLSTNKVKDKRFIKLKQLTLILEDILGSLRYNVPPVLLHVLTVLLLIIVDVAVHDDGSSELRPGLHHPWGEESGDEEVLDELETAMSAELLQVKCYDDDGVSVDTVSIIESSETRIETIKWKLKIRK